MFLKFKIYIWYINFGNEKNTSSLSYNFKTLYEDRMYMEVNHVPKI